MTPIRTSLAALVLAGAAGFAATSVAAQSASAVCAGDYICIDSGVVTAWPLDRWTTVRRAGRPTAAANRGTRNQ